MWLSNVMRSVYGAVIFMNTFCMRMRVCAHAFPHFRRHALRATVTSTWAHRVARRRRRSRTTTRNILSFAGLRANARRHDILECARAPASHKIWFTRCTFAHMSECECAPFTLGCHKISNLYYIWITAHAHFANASGLLAGSGHTCIYAYIYMEIIENTNSHTCFSIKRQAINRIYHLITR